MGFRAVATIVVGVLAATALAGCVSGTPMPTPDAGSATPTPDPTSVRNELDPQLRPGEPAAANEQFFDFVNQQLQTAQGKSSGQAIVDNLVAAGFAKTDMEVTYDSTALGLQADSIIVSVKIGSECLIGQFAPAYYESSIAPLLGTGKCLVGWQRAIDW